MVFEFHVHGLWIIGAISMLMACMIAGNVEWIEGTTQFSYWGAVVIALILFLFAGLCWISSAANAKEDMV